MCVILIGKYYNMCYHDIIKGICYIKDYPSKKAIKILIIWNKQYRESSFIQSCNKKEQTATNIRTLAFRKRLLIVLKSSPGYFSYRTVPLNQMDRRYHDEKNWTLFLSGNLHIWTRPGNFCHISRSWYCYKRSRRWWCAYLCAGTLVPLMVFGERTPMSLSIQDLQEEIDLSILLPVSLVYPFNSRPPRGGRRAAFSSSVIS